jgi:hypothetical protein
MKFVSVMHPVVIMHWESVGWAKFSAHNNCSAQPSAQPRDQQANGGTATPAQADFSQPHTEEGKTCLPWAPFVKRHRFCYAALWRHSPATLHTS